MLNRTSNEKSLVAQGKLLKEFENDLPFISLAEDKIVYCYNTITKEVKQLTKEQEYSANPYIWEDYVAWLVTNPNDNNIVSLYNLKDGVIEFTTELKVLDNFSPTISNNVMILPDETGQNPKFYYINSRQVKTFYELVADFKFVLSFDFRVHNNWISLYPQKFAPHPENRLRATGTYLISINGVVE